MVRKEGCQLDVLDFSIGKNTKREKMNIRESEKLLKEIERGRERRK